MVLMSINDTGNLSSPYLALWVLAALFGAIASIFALVPIAIGTLGYGIFLWTEHTLSQSEWITFGLVILLPLIIGMFFRLRRDQEQVRSSQAVSALTSELNQESSKSSIILESIADGVLLIDKEGAVQLMNPAAERIIGWGGEDATKLDYRSVLKIVDPNDRIVDSTTDPVSVCLNTNESVITDKLGIRTISGKRLIASIMASPLGSGNDGVVVVFRDITAQRAEEREQAEFISTASHEMRTPVATIEGYIALALNPQTATIDDKARIYLAKAQESAANLGRLFQDLLDISKVEDGRLKSDPVVADVTSIAKKIVNDFAGQVHDKPLKVTYGSEATNSAGQSISPLFFAKVDVNHFAEVLTNLVGNAVKYTKEGSVTVEVSGDNDRIFISVSDTGVGIPAEDLPHLFQKFYRVDNTDTREIGGTGLGLYLARRLTETMRGHLTVQSTYGKGSTFTMELPRVPKEELEKSPTTVSDNTSV